MRGHCGDAQIIVFEACLRATLPVKGQSTMPCLLVALHARMVSHTTQMLGTSGLDGALWR